MEYLKIPWCKTVKMSYRSIIFRYFLVITSMQNLIMSDELYHHEEIMPYSQASHQNGRYRSSYSMYSSWSHWSPCSTSCGQGVSKRTRICNRRRDEDLCRGESSEFKICQLQTCLPNEADFRAFQCSQYNNRLVAGQRVKHWVPADGGANPCELRCEAVSEKSVFGFGKVADGTSCTEGVCLDGRCLKVGCDDRIGSGAQWDMCGLCAGRNSTCVHYSDVFTRQPIDRKERRTDYEEIVVLPVGSRNFKIWKPHDKNTLVITDRVEFFQLHGRPSVSNNKPPFGISVSIEDNRTIASLKGPTTVELYVLVSLKEQHPGFRFEYWLPLDHPHLKSLYPKKPPFVKPTSKRPPLTHATIAHTLQTTPPNIEPLPKSSPKPTKSLVPKQSNIVNPIQNTSPFIAKAKSSVSTETNNLKYGPKRFELELSAKSQLTPFDSEKSSINETQFFAFFPNGTYFHRNGVFPTYRFNIKTQKPIFDYYEKYRNTSSFSGSGVYQRKPVFFPHQTQGDSSAPNDEKNSALPKENKKNSKKHKKLHKEKHNKKHKDLSAHWRYQINGKHDSSKDNFLNTPVSITVLPLPDSLNFSKSSRKFIGLTLPPPKPRPTRGGLCEPCQKVRELAKHFCSSDFVIQAVVIGYEFLNGETRYELDVKQSFKNILALLPREYIWAPDTCRCPKLRIGKEYLIMGKIDSNYRRNESRLLVDQSCFTRIFNGKHGRRLSKLKKNHHRRCSKIS